MRLWNSTRRARRPFMVEKRHPFAYVLRRSLSSLRAVAHPRRRRLTIDDLKLESRAA